MGSDEPVFFTRAWGTGVKSTDASSSPKRFTASLAISGGDVMAFDCGEDGRPEAGLVRNPWVGEVRKPLSFNGDDMMGFGEMVLWLKMAGDGREEVGLALFMPDVNCVWPKSSEAGMTFAWPAKPNSRWPSAGVSGAKTGAVAVVPCDEGS
jgi:hypothetical protein